MYVFGTTFDRDGSVLQRQLGSYGSRVFQDYTYQGGTRRLIKADTIPELKGYASNVSYDYDPAGNITRAVDNPDNNPDTQCFRYDYLNRLTDAWTPKATGTDGTDPGNCDTLPTSTTDLGGPASYWQTYRYGSTGNRTSLTKHITGGDTTVASVYPAPGGNQPHTLSSTTTTFTIAEGSVATEQSTYTYDASGNTTSRTIGGNTQTLTWNDEGRLASLTAGDASTGYLYDASGNLLIRHDPDGSATLWLPDGTELHATGDTVTGNRYYSHLGATIAVRTPNSLTWITSDPHGTGSVQVDAKTLTPTHRYTDPFGQPRSSLPAWIGNRGFVGGIDDPTTGLTHLGAREYDPTTGRFISADPLADPADPQQLNGYAYANNDPVNSADPSGLRVYGGAQKALGDKAFFAFMDGWTGGTAWRRDYYPINKAWEADTAAHDNTKSNHELLDLLGYIPVIGTVADLANGIWYATEGNWKEAGLSFVSAAVGLIPFGKLAKLAGKIVLKVAVKASSKAIEKTAAKAVVKRAAKGVAKAAEKSGVKRAAKPLARAADKDGSKAAHACHSFTGDTRVELSDGTSKPISTIHIGDKIRNAEPDSPKSQAHRVDGVIVTTTDHDLVDLTVTTPQGPRTLTTTRHHLFWDATTHHWTQATHLRLGHHLQTTHRHTTTLVAIHRYTTTSLTYDLTINHLHTYNVLAGESPILVHNCGNVLSNSHGYSNADALASHGQGSAFSGVYEPGSGTFRAHLNVDDDMINPPVNAVRMHGGHGRVNFEYFEGSRTTVGFTLFTEGDNTFSVAWLSRGVNGRNYGDPMAPVEYRERIMSAISSATGWAVRQR